MASRKPPPAPAQAALTVEQMRKGIVRLDKVIKEIEAFDPSQVSKRWGPEQTALETSIEGTLSSVFGHNTVEFRRYARAASLDNGAITMDIGFGGAPRDNSHEARKYVTEGKIEAIQILQSAVKWLHDEISNADESTAAAGLADGPASQSRKIFIVHGHDEGAQQTVARFIESIGFEAIILSEQANQGRTVIEKIEMHGDVGFAVVLLTPDDVGGKSSESLRPRARQNVLLELGYFLARLKRERVCTLVKGDLEFPTDFAGVVWQRLDDAGAWKQALARELKTTGYEIDWNKVMA